jgi:hypothetical protein
MQQKNPAADPETAIPSFFNFTKINPINREIRRHIVNKK